jgi:hypothetical protein
MLSYTYSPFIAYAKQITITDNTKLLEKFQHPIEKSCK